MRRIIRTNTTQGIVRVRSQALQPIGGCRGLPTIASLYDVFDVLFVASALTYLATAAFAIRVAIWGDTVFAGAPGHSAAYEFVKPEGVGKLRRISTSN